MLFEMSSFNKAYLEFTKTLKNFRFNKSENQDISNVTYIKTDDDNKNSIGYSLKSDVELKDKSEKNKGDKPSNNKNPFTEINKPTTKNNKNDVTKNQNSGNFSSFMLDDDFEDKEWAIKGDLSVADALVRTFKLATYRVRSFSTHCSQQSNNTNTLPQVTSHPPKQFQQQASPSQPLKNSELNTFPSETQNVQVVDQKTQRQSRNKIKKQEKKHTTYQAQQNTQYTQQNTQPFQQSVQQQIQQTQQQQIAFNDPVPFTNPGTSNLFNSQKKDVKKNDTQQKDTQKIDALQIGEQQIAEQQQKDTQQNIQSLPKPLSQTEYALVDSEYVLITRKDSDCITNAIRADAVDGDFEKEEKVEEKCTNEGIRDGNDLEGSVKNEFLGRDALSESFGVLRVGAEDEEEEEDDGGDDDVGNAITGSRNEINIVGEKFVRNESGDYNEKNNINGKTIIKNEVINKPKTQKTSNRNKKHDSTQSKQKKDDDYEDKENNNITPSIWLDKRLLKQLFKFVERAQIRSLSQVCSVWKDVIYDRKDLWKKMEIRIFCKDLNKKNSLKNNFFSNLERRKIPSLIFENITDPNVAEVIKLCPYMHQGVTRLAIRNSNIGDKALKNLVESATRVIELELVSCNEVTEVGLWSCLPPKLHHLKLADCINVADDTVAAIGHLLSNLQSLNLQAYHVTNASLSTFSSKQSMYLKSLKLVSCWEVTNHGVVNVIRWGCYYVVLVLLLLCWCCYCCC